MKPAPPVTKILMTMPRYFRQDHNDKIPVVSATILSPCPMGKRLTPIRKSHAEGLLQPRPSSTEDAGRRAGVGNSAVVIGNNASTVLFDLFGSASRMRAQSHTR